LNKSRKKKKTEARKWSRKNNTLSSTAISQNILIFGANENKTKKKETCGWNRNVTQEVYDFIKICECGRAQKKKNS
jgi:hypothetical protein